MWEGYVTAQALVPLSVGGGGLVAKSCLTPGKPTRLLCPWDFPGKNTGVGCHYLFQGTLSVKHGN